MREDERCADAEKLFSGGAMGATMRAVDWAKTALGPVERWSPALRTMVGLLLRNQTPILLWWGSQFVQLYNDAYRPVLGAKHPNAMGQRARECWEEIFHIIGPMIDQPFGGGRATKSDDLDLLLKRKDFTEETHFVVAYSPVPDETVQPTGVGGVIATVTETTEQVYAHRQLKTLRELGARATEATTAERACELAAETLAQNGRDVPFVLVYLLDEQGRGAQLVSHAGFDDRAAALFPQRVEPGERGAAGATGAIARVLDGQAAQVFAGVEGWPHGAWAVPPQKAIAVPLGSADKRTPYGALVCAVSPHRRLDEGYQGFFELASAQVVTAIRNARAYQEERRRAEMLAELDRAKTHFFSNVSHEFRTPLTLMLAPTEDLLEGVHGELSEAQRSQLELLRRNELRLQRLVNALLEFSRIEAGRTNARYQPADLPALTRELAASFRAAIERSGLKFDVDCPDQPEPAFVDPTMWEQLVLNLLSNAFKFTFEGEISARLALGPAEWVLEVSDTGVGVREDEVPRLFERFHRVEGTRARTHEGSGIGLALVQELVKLHGGAVTASSRFGEGTTFRVTIPRGRAHLPPERVSDDPKAGPVSPTRAAFVEEAARWLPGAAAAPRVTAQRQRVLVADDNADMREYLARILGAELDVETVADGGAALEAARRRPPALIVTDVMMPVLDGFRLLQALRAGEATKAIPVILLSARAGEEARLEGLQAGADDYLVKPFSAKELLARARVQLQAGEAVRRLELERRRLEAVLENVPASICSLEGPGHVFGYANQRCLDDLGRRPLLGRPLAEAVPELAAQGYVALLDRVLESGEPYRASAAPLRLASGERWFDFLCQPRKSAQGQVESILYYGFDVTAQVLAWRRSEEDRQAAEAAVKMRDEFLAIASHELRTPLTTLGLQLDGLVRDVRRSGAMGPAGQHWLERASRVRDQSERLEQVIDGMMDVFALGGAQGQLSLERVDLAEVARAVLPRFQPRPRQPRPPIRLSAERAVGRWDKKRVDQIVSQLVSNAVKFGAGRPISVFVEPAPGQRARLKVVDGGIGIARPDHERIFQRFERAAPARNYGGFGMGLWVVRELVAAMRGRVSVDSELGQGSTFTVELPSEA